MSYQVLYRTYRPASFEEVIGQDYIIKTLQNAIRLNKIAHAYLFAGPRGTGKTSVAKLFAKAINCTDLKKGEPCNSCPSCKSFNEGEHPDIIEMDAASKNGVDDIREIVEEVGYAPILGKYKVYIIDEVHMLSASAFNALLKTLEEPPAHVVFILATTDPQKIIPTVLSRCQRYNFNKITTYDIKAHLIDIMNKENIAYEEEAVEEISKMAEGGMRDALSILEQCLSYNDKEVKTEDIEKIFGLTSTNREVEILTKAYNGEISEVVKDLRAIYSRGSDLKRLALDFIEIIKESVIYSDSASKDLLRKILPMDAQEMLRHKSVNQLIDDARILEDAIYRDSQNSSFLSSLELALIKMSKKEETASITPVKKETVKKEAVKEEVKEEKAEVIIEPEEETVIETKAVDLDFLLPVLFNATKNDKINDGIIYNRLEMYKYDEKYRKFFSLLSETELFASSRDAIIITGKKSVVDTINETETNKELYYFINEEHHLDKMVYALTKEDLEKLILMYKNATPEQRKKEQVIVKYKDTDKPKTKEDELRDIFGDIRVEE